MPKYPDRKFWDARNKCMMYFPTPSVDIQVGSRYRVEWIDHNAYSFSRPLSCDVYNGRIRKDEGLPSSCSFTVASVRVFKSLGRRWTLHSRRGARYVSCFLYESEILRQDGSSVLAAMPWLREESNLVTYAPQKVA